MCKSEHALTATHSPKLNMNNRQGRSWNSGKHVGPRDHWTPVEAQAIVSTRQQMKDWHDACLAAVGIDLFWRKGDLLALKVSDLVHHYGEPRTEIRNRQEKTDCNVRSYLSPVAQQTIVDWVSNSGKSYHDYVFTRRKRKDGTPISEHHLNRVVKGWVKDIGGNPERYGGHTLRRTKAIYLYKHGFANIEEISVLLGHTSVKVTLRYLGITEEEAKAAALKGDIFKHDTTRSPLTHPLLYHFLEPVFLDRFTDALADRLAPKIAKLISKKNRESKP